MKRFKVILIVFACTFLFLAVKSVLAYYGGSDINKYEDNVFGKPTEYNSSSFGKQTFSDLEGAIVSDIFGATQEKYRSITGTGAIGGVSNLIAQLYTHPPASSKEYFADLGRNLGIVKSAYAQGVGFTGLSNLLPLWKATRNLAYIAFVVVFLYMGLAIMFRIKLDPKTVVTIQNAIPKLVIGLILVTFSYAIAGLMIDLIYLIIYLGVLALREPLQVANASNPDYSFLNEQLKFANLGFGNAIKTIFGGLLKGLSSTTTTAVGGVIGYVLSSVGVAVAFALTGWGLAAAAILPLVIIGVIVLFLIFKLFFSLIGCYITIILSVIIAPLQILMGVLPGSQGGFGSWFRNLLANILVFPTVALVILLGWLLTGTYGPTWSPPVLGLSGGALTPILGIGMLLLVNKIPDVIKSAFKMKPAGYGAAIGQALGPASAVGTLALGNIIGTGGRLERRDVSAGGTPGALTATAQALRKIFKIR